MGSRWAVRASVGLALLVGCGEKRTAGENSTSALPPVHATSRGGTSAFGPAWSSSRVGPLLPKGTEAIRSGLTVVVSPFADEGPDGAAPLSPRGPDLEVTALLSASGGLRLQAPVTIPGFHWPWSAPLPAEVTVFGQDGATRRVALPSSRGAPDVDPASGIRYSLRLGELQRRTLWPALLGTKGLSGGLVSLSDILPFVPERLEEPMRVIFVGANGEGLPVVSPGAACGTGCVDFANYAAALDSPLTFARRPADLTTLETGAGVTFVASVDARLPPSFPTKKILALAARTLGPYWRTLNARFGDLGLTSSYQTHVAFLPGCAFQGLEHDDAAVLAVGGQCGSVEANARNVIRTAAHEWVHAWNVRRLYPVEHYPWNVLSFDAARDDSLFFYEGFTEAYSMMLLAELAPEFQSDVIRRLNDDATTAQLSVRTPEAPSEAAFDLVGAVRQSPFLGYQMGTFMAFHLAAAAKAQFGHDEARDRFFALLPTLAARVGVKSFKRSPAEDFIFRGPSVVLKRGAPQGYTRDDLRVVIAQTLGDEAGSIFDSYLSASAPVLNDTSVLAAGLQLIATQTGTVVTSPTQQSGVHVAKVLEPTSVPTWPLGPSR